MRLIDDARSIWRMWSVWLQSAWGVVCTTYVAMPADQQAALLEFFHVKGAGAAAAVQFFATVSVGVSAATIAARAIKQPGVSGPGNT